MALMYPWATKEYILWEMSLPQLILYHNLGIEQKYPSPDEGKSMLRDMTVEEAKAAREEARRIMAETEDEERERQKQPYRDKYGAI